MPHPGTGSAAAAEPHQTDGLASAGEPHHAAGSTAPPPTCAAAESHLSSRLEVIDVDEWAEGEDKRRRGAVSSAISMREAAEADAPQLPVADAAVAAEAHPPAMEMDACERAVANEAEAAEAAETAKAAGAAGKELACEGSRPYVAMPVFIDGVRVLEDRLPEVKVHWKDSSEPVWEPMEEQDSREVCDLVRKYVSSVEDTKRRKVLTIISAYSLPH